MIDMAMLIMEMKPDGSGNIIPPSVQEGSAQFSSAKGRNDTITLVIAGGIYNVTTATCGNICTNCCGLSNFGINQVAVPIGGFELCEVTTVDCNGSQVYPKSWSTSNSAIMTVDSSNYAHGVSVGSVTITGIYSFAPVYTGQVCNTSCPTSNVSPQANGNTTPAILLGGSSGTDITNTTQNVVVGQQIVLYAKYTLPSGESVTSQSWDPGNGSTIVGGYNASPASGSVVTAQTNAQSTTFYWVTPGTSTVTFDLTLSGSSSAIPATATFNISAPSPATPTVSLPTNGQLYVDTLTGCTNNPSGPNLVFGNISGPVPGCPGTYTGQPGIAFSPPTASTPAGNFFFVQTVNSDTVNYNSLTCSAISGLDGAYPYQSKTGQAVNDAPFSPLPSTYSTSSRSFNATMYLMWQSTTQDSIPAPMGYVTWQFSGSTTQSNGVWGTPTGSGGPGNFVTATSPSFYPTWQGLAVTANNNCH